MLTYVMTQDKNHKIELKNIYYIEKKVFKFLRL